MYIFLERVLQRLKMSLFPCETGLRSGHIAMNTEIYFSVSNK